MRFWPYLHFPNRYFLLAHFILAISMPDSLADIFALFPCNQHFISTFYPLEKTIILTFHFAITQFFHRVHFV